MAVLPGLFKEYWAIVKYNAQPEATYSKENGTMDKGLNDAVNVLAGWVNLVVDVLLATLLLPFNLIGGLLE